MDRSRHRRQSSFPSSLLLGGRAWGEGGREEGPQPQQPMQQQQREGDEGEDVLTARLMRSPEWRQVGCWEWEG